MNNKNRTCDDSHRTSYSYIIKFNDIICYRNRKYTLIQSVCSATLNTPKVAIEPKRDKFLFKKLAIKAQNFYSTANLTELSGKPNTFWNVSIIP